MVEQCQRAFATLNRIIEWAKPRGRVSQKVDLKNVIEDLVSLVRDEFREDRKIEIVVKVDDVPSVKVGLDGIRMTLTDIFWNAAKAMPSGGSLTVGLTSDGDLIKLTVKDTGEGMSEERIKEVFNFNPMGRISPGGIGLGLYLCKKVVDAAGGQIDVESEIGIGTTVNVRFPITNGVKP